MEKAIDHSVLTGDYITWAENEYIKLGVNLGLGGAVTYLAEHGQKNLINSADWGRQVQMSFYSHPVPFHPEGHDMRESWKYIGWNPIQCGDCYGNRSQILEYENKGDSIYVKCIPMHWPLDNYPGECTFETWYKLVGKRVDVIAKINNARPDTTKYEARHQELPAVYTNGEWYKIISYIGNKPFSEDNTKVLIDIDDGKGWPWITFRPTENWAALLNCDNYGLGIMNPITNNFLGGFAGQKGSGGEKDGPTGYLSPTLAEVLDYNIVYDYNYSLIVGNVEEIRKTACEIAPPTKRKFSFDGTRDHWSYRGITDKGFPVPGFLEFDFNAGNSLAAPELFWKNLSGIKFDGIFTSDSEITGKVTVVLYDGQCHERGYQYPTKSFPFSFNGSNERKTYTASIGETGEFGIVGLYVEAGCAGHAKIFGIELV